MKPTFVLISVVDIPFFAFLLFDTCANTHYCFAYSFVLLLYYILFCSKIVHVLKDGVRYVSVEVNSIIILAMNKDGILSDDKLKMKESVQPNGQHGDDIIVIDSQSDENKAGAKTNIRDDLFKEHKEPVCRSRTVDNNVNDEETSIADDDSEADSNEFFLCESDNEQASASEVDTEVCGSNKLLNYFNI